MAGFDIANDRSWTDKRMEKFIGNLLRAGVLLSAMVVLCGAAVYLVRHGHAPANYRAFQSEPSDLRSVGGILRDAVALRGRGIIQLGLLLLIATPVARVAFSIFGFAEEHDRLYVIVASIVLLVLLYSLIGSAWSV
ncbi:MAG: DUF1634 domain-containing protein [Candidatus Sulfotelmatobacter sp.]|jgi:uncharacterized membrane protein